MKLPTISLASLGLSSMLLLGCAQPGQPGFTKEQVGTVAGAVAGGVIGKNVGDSTAATIGGTILGGYLGQQVGRSLDRADRLAMERRAYRAVSRGQTQQWRSSNNRYYMQARPQRTYTYRGHRCRNYVTSIQDRQGNLIRKVRGTACQRADGSWYVTDRRVVVP
jgi:surface antigen